ncbi:aminodeoxychorismate synthase component I [uncultured Methylibium sp.]|uniref:aminodeoxychorismate synthase component I n=1 Tax=uncultured Methylibium sp. TaxID=381093 RepID=UPI0025D78363|nr:aminodeoxychorismate synthase component I [uncultured Methylibium sp.]
MNTTPVFALLDDRAASAEHPTSRLYTAYAHERRCIDPAALDAFWAEVEADQKLGLHALLLIDYEWGSKLLGAGRRPGDEAAALRVLLFRELRFLSRDDADRWLARQDDSAEPRPAGVLDVQASVTRDEFHAAIGRIHEAIRAGETYQVNYTYRLDFAAHGAPVSLYRRLRARQPVPYGAFVALPPSSDAQAPTHVLSCSPELFVRHAAGRLTARPMKGTAPRRAVMEGDSETARHLHLDTKNRAENLMIVDLLRNDLGRIATVGSVRVPGLFDVESHATVFQMTSTVEAEAKAGLGMPELLRAIFPCGSITGAPKYHTMDLIAGLESTPRGLYCGAIGWMDAPTQAGSLGDFCLSVAIRTLTLGPERDGLRAGRLGIGAGIVLDSVAEDEYAECQLKGRFLTGLDPGFAIFETMHAMREAGVRHLDRHLARLGRSAATLGFVCDEIEMREAIQLEVGRLAPDAPHRLRLGLARSGRFDLIVQPLAPLPDGPVGLRIEPRPLPAARPLSAHKSTLRAEYDAGLRAAEASGAFDSLFFTPDGWLVEGGRSNVFVRLDGRWFTPPLADGALPGVMRGLLLEDPAWAATERSLTRAELLRAEAIVVCNALRGALPARLA